MEEEALQFLYVISGGTLFLFFIWYLHCLYFSLINIKENDKCTSHVQQGYNTPLTWGGLHKLWGPPHMRGVLYPCCTCDVRESPLIFIIKRGQKKKERNTTMTKSHIIPITLNTVVNVTILCAEYYGNILSHR